MAAESGDDGHDGDSGVLFPCFTALIGIFAYYVLSRYAPVLPYTAVMFVVGALLGYLSLQTDGNHIVESVQMWLSVNGEVVLLVFLPGLLFLDSFNTNVYLFRRAFSQLLVFAFPMVLAGTYATAFVARFLFGWTFNLSMTFGSILAATDPVAVAVLLNALGAPPRLKIHIAGESLLNDGSAVVFFHIFSSRFFYELGVDGFGEDIGWLRGILLFLRLSLGGACIGIIFGMGLVSLLFNLNRRLSQQENVIQVTGTITIAYLSFFFSEVVCHCSGILAVVFCGVTTKAFGDTLLNDSHLTHDFWHITEHLLNSILFALGGAVWGGVVSSLDWISLLIVFGSAIVIRFLLLLAFYPITANLGLGQSWREAVFMGYGGLRGAVGIALALMLKAQVFHYTEHVEEDTRVQYRDFTSTLFGMVGGVAFLSLVINGTSAGFALRALGLVTPTKTREKVVSGYVEHAKCAITMELLSLLSDKRFQEVDFGVVREHVSPLKTLTEEELHTAIERYQRKFPDKEPPNTASIECYVSSSQNGQVERYLARSAPGTRLLKPMGSSSGPGRQTIYNFHDPLDEKALVEERAIFVNLLRREYHRQLATGELDSRGFIPHSLLQSLDIAAANTCLPLDDWAASQSAGNAIVKKADRALHAYRVGGLCSRQDARDEDFHAIRTRVLLALSFINAHLKAQETFKVEFASVNTNSLTMAEKAVIDESRDQVSKAESAIKAFDEDDVNAVKSQYVCGLLLHKSASYFRHLQNHGLLTERESGEFLDQYDRELRELRVNSELKSQARWSSTSKISPELGRLGEVLE